MNSRVKAESLHTKKKFVIHTVSNIGPRVDVGGCHFCNQQKRLIRDKHPYCLMSGELKGLVELINHSASQSTYT